MEWAKRAGVLAGIKIPPELIPYVEKAGPQTAPDKSSSTPATTQKTGTSPRSKRDDKVANYVAIGLNVWAWRDQRIKQGNPPTTAEIEAKVRTEVVKNKVQNLQPRDINKMVRKVKRFLRYFSY